MSSRNSHAGRRAAARKKDFIRFEFIISLVLSAIPFGWDMSGLPHSIVGACLLWGVSFALLAHAFWRSLPWTSLTKALTVGVASILIIAFSYRPVLNQYRIEHTKNEPAVSHQTIGFKAQYTRGLQVNGVNSVGSEVGVDLSNSDSADLTNVNTFATDKEFQTWLDHLSSERAATIDDSIAREQATLSKRGKQMPSEVVRKIKALANNPAQLKAYLGSLQK